MGIPAREHDILPRHRVFADEWLTGEHTGKRFNGRAAYEHAGYAFNEANPHSNPSKLLRHPKVQKYIASRLQEYTMDAQEVLIRLTEIARGNYGDILKKDPQTQRLKIDHDKVKELKHLVKSYGFDSNGNEKIEFHDPMRAIENIAKVLDMFKTQLEITGPGGGPITHRYEVQFVAPDGTGMDLGPTNELTGEEEDFSELDRLGALPPPGMDE